MAEPFIHPTALVETDLVGEDTRVWAFAHLLAGTRIGARCNLCDHVFVESGATVGNNVTVKNNVCLWDGVTLADDVFVGPNVAFTNDRYPRSARMAEARQRYSSTSQWLLETVVERGASIGANATIVPGVRIGRYSMIAAGAVVTGDVAPFALVVGSPARRIGDVCRCGQRLIGPYQSTVCHYCGEMPTARDPGAAVPLAAAGRATS